MKSGQGHRMTATSYRLYPNATSERRMLATLEHCRSLYNHLLADCKADAIEGICQKSMFEMDAEVKRVADGDPGMKRTVYSTCLRDVGRRVFNAMRGCGWNDDGNLEHLPRFKSEHRYRSFTYRTNQGFGFEGDAIVLSKIGRMRCRGRRPPKNAEPRMCTVKLDARGHWHATVVYRIPDIKRGWTGFEGPAYAVGYDLGLRDVVTSSEWEHVVCPEFLRGSRDEVRRLQRTMSEEERGSPRWERARRRLAVIHLDIRNRRKGFFDRLAHDMTDGRAVIVMENLDIRKMKEGDGTPAAVRDKYTEANWGYLTRRIGFKAEEAGSRMILVDPRYTSRTCSRCGHVVQSLPLSQRTFSCETCGNMIDRDWNAAINILNRGLGVEAVRKENGRRGRQHGCWPVCRRSATHLGLTSP